MLSFRSNIVKSLIPWEINLDALAPQLASNVFKASFTPIKLVQRVIIHIQAGNWLNGTFLGVFFPEFYCLKHLLQYCFVCQA